MQDTCRCRPRTALRCRELFTTTSTTRTARTGPGHTARRHQRPAHASSSLTWNGASGTRWVHTRPAARGAQRAPAVRMGSEELQVSAPTWPCRRRGVPQHERPTGRGSHWGHRRAAPSGQQRIVSASEWPRRPCAASRRRSRERLSCALKATVRPRPSVLLN
jgi:hypothetical protein